MDFEEKYKNIYEKYEFADLLKILCAITAREIKEAKTDNADITEVIFGSGYKFTINLKAEPHNTWK